MEKPESGMGYSGKARYTAGFLLLVLLLAGLCGFSLCTGTISAAPGEVLRVLAGSGQGELVRIIMGIRLPRTLSVVILGGALAESGFLLQTFFANPIAGPFVLGISSGAKLVTAAFMIYVLSMGYTPDSRVMTAAAFGGSLIVLGFVMLISRRVADMSVLVICGVMAGYICNAATDLMVTFADDSNIVNLHHWSMGSFSGMSMDMVRLMAIMVIPAFAAVFLLSKPMAAYQLGDVYAANMGVDLKLFRIELILLSGLLSAVVTAFAGPVSFVGVAVPRLMKGLFRTSRPIVLIPASFLGGSVFCLFCDLLARRLFAPTELSISTVTAVFGAPVVIGLMLKRRGLNHNI